MFVLENQLWCNCGEQTGDCYHHWEIDKEGLGQQAEITHMPTSSFIFYSWWLIPQKYKKKMHVRFYYLTLSILPSNFRPVTLAGIIF